MAPLAALLPAASASAIPIGGGLAFEPVLTATAAAVGGIGLAGYGQMAQGQAIAQQAEGQAAIADYNAKVQEQEARAAEAATVYEQNRQAEEARRLSSGLLANAGASGLVPSQGAPLMVEAEQAAQSELDNLMIGYKGQLAASRARSQGTVDSLQEGIYRRSSRNASLAGGIGSGTTLLSGFGELAARKYGY